MSTEVKVPYSSLNSLQLNADILALWSSPDSNPALNQYYIERNPSGPVRDRLCSNITVPEMVLIRPERSNGIGLLIIPGGGYTKTALDKEGMDSARALAEKGYTSFVLNHRMPGDGHPLGSDTALADAQRAMRLIRARATQFGLEHIGVLGFSAGGHLAGWLSTQYDKPCYSAQDADDTHSARPDFTALMYPVISMDDTITHLGTRKRLLGTLANAQLHPEFSIETMVTANTPPCFLVHASDDPAVSPENSLVMWHALKEQGIAAELHIVEKGGHGFGIRNTLGLPVHTWPEWLDNWIHQQR